MSLRLRLSYQILIEIQTKFMKKILTALTIFSLSFVITKAEPLPFLDIKDWLGYHALSKGKYHAIGLNQDGEINLFFMKRDAKINVRTPVELKLRIERKEKKVGSKWSTKSIKTDGFINPPKASEEAEKVTLHGVITGDIEFKIEASFTKEGVLMNAGFVGEPSDAAKADYRISLSSKVYEMYSMSKTAVDEAKDIKSKTRGCELRIGTRKGKPQKVRFYEPLDIEKLAKDEIVSLELKAEKIGRKNLYWSLANPKLGSLQIVPRAKSNMVYDGFKVSTVLLDETGKKLSDGILLEYK